MRRDVRRAAALLTFLSSTVSLGMSTAPARADDQTLDACIAANNEAVSHKEHARLLAARADYARCAVPSCGAEISSTCQKGIDEVNSKLPSLLFVPKNGMGQDVAGVRLSINGTLYAERLDGSAVVLDPGSYEFRFEVAGQEPVTKTFVVLEGEQRRREEVLIGPPAPPPPTPPTQTSQPPPQQTQGGTPPAQTVVVRVETNSKGKDQLDSTGAFQRTAGTLLLAIGLPVGIVATSVLGYMASANWDSAKKDWPGTQGQNEYKDAKDTARWADIAGVATGVVAVGGILLRVTAPSRRPIVPPPSQVQVAPVPMGDRGGGLLVSGRFP